MCHLEQSERSFPNGTTTKIFHHKFFSRSLRHKPGGMPDSFESIEKIALDQLPLVDLQGNPALLSNYFQKHLLLIFLRHLA
jgi:hypothetical protein